MTNGSTVAYFDLGTNSLNYSVAILAEWTFVW
jgi:hypothetical protein